MTIARDILWREPLNPQLEALVTRPSEDLHIEIKNWIDLTDPAGKATLAKAIIVLANHGGGFVVIGLAERADGTFPSAGSSPPNLNSYSQDAVNGIVQAYAAPVFHCGVHHVDHAATGDRFPVIQVPGGHRAPVQAIKGSPDQWTLINGKYYIGAPEAQVVFTIRWSGLRGRELQDVERRRDFRAGRIAQQDEIELSITVPAGSTDKALPEIVY